MQLLEKANDPPSEEAIAKLPPIPPADDGKKVVLTYYSKVRILWNIEHFNNRVYKDFRHNSHINQRRFRKMIYEALDQIEEKDMWSTKYFMVESEGTAVKFPINFSYYPGEYKPHTGDVRTILNKFENPVNIPDKKGNPPFIMFIESKNGEARYYPYGEGFSNFYYKLIESGEVQASFKEIIID